MGYQALRGSTAIQNNYGTKNTALGYQAMLLNQSGSSNTALGYLSLSNNNSGSNNIAIGENAMNSNTANSNNVAVGFEALKSSVSNDNVALGYQAGTYSTPNTSGAQNTYLGAYTFTSNGGFNNSTAIGYNAQITNSNMIRLGNGNITDVFTTGNYNTTRAFISTLVTDATSATADGALRIAGGAAIAKKLYVGSDAAVAGIMSVTNATASSAFNSGALVVSGGVGIAGALNVNGAQVFTGATTHSSTLIVAGVSTFNNNVSIPGASTFTVGTGATTLGGALTVSGAVNLNGLSYAVTPSSGDNTTRIATTAYVLDAMTTSNNSWTADGNASMTDYTASFNGTQLDNTTFYETSTANNATYLNNYYGNKSGSGVWSVSNATVSNTLRFMGTTDASALNLRVYKMRSGRIDYDANLGQASFGYGAAKNTWLSSNTTYGGLYNYRGTKNTAFGYEALTSTNVGKENTALGYRALKNNNSYNGMVAVGFEAMANFTDMVEGNFYSNPGAYGLQYGSSYEAYNTAVGYQALKGSAAIQNNNGYGNTALGYQAMTVNTSGSNNTALGYQTLKTNSTGGQNVAIGQSALSLNNLSNYNTAVGYEALRNAETAGTNSNQGFNTAIGYQAGTYSTPLTTGYNNTFLGTYTYSTVNTVANSTAIGYQAFVNANNMIQLGNTSVTLVNTSGVLKTVNGTTSTSTATGALQVTGGAGITGALWVGGAVTTGSDRRIKKDIVNTSFGLKEILQLRPVDYKLLSSNENEIGFIAQEVKQIIPTVVSGTEGDLEKGEFLGLKYQNLIPVLAKSIQELNALNTKTQTDLNTKLSYSTPSQLTLGNANVKEVITTANVTVGESLSVKHLKGNSSTPGIQATTGAGNNAVVKITGTDMSGVIEVATGEMPIANAILSTIQYSTAYSSAPVVIITPGNAATASLMGTSTVFVGSNTSTDFTLNTNATPLVSKTTYKWYYQVIQ